MPFNASIGAGLVNAQKPPPGVSQGVGGQAPPQQNAVPKQPAGQPIQSLGKAPQPQGGGGLGGLAGLAPGGQAGPAPAPPQGGWAGMIQRAGGVAMGAGQPPPRQWNFGGAVRGGVPGQGNAYAPQSMRSPAQPRYLPGPQAPQGIPTDPHRALPGPQSTAGSAAAALPQQGYGGAFLPGPQTALPGPQTGSTALPGPQTALPGPQMPQALPGPQRQQFGQGMGGAFVPLASQGMMR